eukprot:g2871.t1
MFSRLRRTQASRFRHFSSRSLDHMSSGSDIIIRSQPSIQSITLNREKALNALNLSMIRKLTPLLLDWCENPEVHTVFMHGSGPKAFCAGGDVVSLWKNGKEAETRSNCHNFFTEEYRLNHLLGTYPIPIVAWLNGITMGGGVGLSVHGSFRVATESTIFAMPEVGIGFFPDVGGSYFLPRLPHPNLGMYLALTGAQLRGVDVFLAGIATHFSANDMKDTFLSELSKRFAPGLSTQLDNIPNPSAHLNSLVRNALDVVTLNGPDLKRLQSFVRGDDGSHGIDGDIQPNAALFQDPRYLHEVQECFQSKDASVSSLQEIYSRVQTYAEKEKVAGMNPKTEGWAQSALKAMDRASPLAMAVTHAQVCKGSQLGLEDCLKMEYRIACKFMDYPSQTTFFEGVRAQLIDKDRNPKWERTIDELTDDMVDEFFQPFPDVKDELRMLNEFSISDEKTTAKM